MDAPAIAAAKTAADALAAAKKTAADAAAAAAKP
uniref:Ice-structuring protein GS-5 n=1 Tax=Myoxocephalus aenaeus TaxID=8096 RepID=ANP5_MYOAE|nr:RecName: Full=Ice-structuring protein GS-5; Short=ISP GS-5; AltName: Full=Antifreeze peptide GS-5 [Myoxocephalus aenaeas]prf//1412196A Ala rich antifreeze protein [Myoxocephalus aenaeas]